MRGSARFLDLEGKLETLRTQWPPDIGPPPDPVRLLRTMLADSARENDPTKATQFPGINLRDFEALLKTYRECKGIILRRFVGAGTLKQVSLRAL
jgi:hypothetical protein